MKSKLFSAVLLASVLSIGLPPVLAQSNQNDNGFTHDMKQAGHNTKEAGKDTGHGVEHGSKKVWHKTKRGTKKVTHKGAQKTDEGAQHIERHTEPQ